MTPRQTTAALVTSLALFVASVMPLLAQTPIAEEKSVYIGHSARLTATMPSDWHYDGSAPYPHLNMYSGADGFVSSVPIPTSSLEEACAISAAELGAEDTPAEWNGQPACQIDGTFMNRTARALVIPHPSPFVTFGTTNTHAAVITDPDHFAAITQTISFDPDRVTPSAYLSSVIDIVEAHAWFGTEVDWEWLRPFMLEYIDDDSDISLVYGSLVALLDALRSYGDNHSFLLFPDRATAFQEARGFGMIVGGTRIIATFPAGPAAKAGLQIGDVILTVNGLAPGNLPGIDPGAGYNPTLSWPLESTLTVKRPGEPELLDVSLTATVFEYYRPPVGQSLHNGLGYIDIPGYRIPGREVEFSQQGIDLITTIDQQQSTCGWVVDLRLNTGGSYSPMVSAISPLVGNGTFVGWLDRDGETEWISMEDGGVNGSSGPVSSYIPDTGPTLLSQPNPPVAVLTSNLTGSSGEVTTLAFVGHPSARSFGETTGGYTTANGSFSLFDGTTLLLASAAMVDRNGTTYLDSIPPDQNIAIDWTTYGTTDDPVLIAAQEWLLQQPACEASQRKG